MGRVLLVLGAVALVTAGCASSNDAPATADGASAATTTVATTAPPTTVDEEAAILAAVDGYWDSYFVVNDPPDPSHPDLARYRTGDALETTRANVEERADLGQTVRLPPSSVSNHAVSIVEISADRAVVVDCSVDDSLLVEDASGRILNDAVYTNLWRIELRRQDMWRVASSSLENQWEGVQICEGS